MAEGKRYYWLKLKDDFFASRRIKKLRKIPNGDCYTIIYLKLQLLALKTEGYLYYEGLEESFAAELALDLDEEPENVAITLEYLIRTQLAQLSADGRELYLPWVTENTGSEGAGAQRMRNLREREGVLVLPAAPCDAVLSQCDEVLSQCDTLVTERKSKSQSQSKSKREDTETETIAAKPQCVFKRPSLQDVIEYCREKGYRMNPEEFIDHYDANGWKVGRTPMKDWKAAVRNWERRELYGKSQSVSRNAESKGADRFSALQLYDA